MTPKASEVRASYGAPVLYVQMEMSMDSTTLLIVILLILILFGGGYYGRGRWW
jgi:hypothetical protein